jgi:hypothetical protein
VENPSQIIRESERPIPPKSAAAHFPPGPGGRPPCSATIKRDAGPRRRGAIPEAIAVGGRPSASAGAIRRFIIRETIGRGTRMARAAAPGEGARAGAGEAPSPHGPLS